MTSILQIKKLETQRHREFNSTLITRSQRKAGPRTVRLGSLYSQWLPVKDRYRRLNSFFCLSVAWCWQPLHRTYPFFLLYYHLYKGLSKIRVPWKREYVLIISVTLSAQNPGPPHSRCLNVQLSNCISHQKLKNHRHTYMLSPSVREGFVPFSCSAML